MNWKVVTIQNLFCFWLTTTSFILKEYKMLEKISDVLFCSGQAFLTLPHKVISRLPSVPCCRMLHTLLSLLWRIISTCLIQTFGFHTQERTDQDQDPGKIVFLAHLIRFSLFPTKLIRIYFWYTFIWRAKNATLSTTTIQDGGHVVLEWIV